MTTGDVKRVISRHSQIEWQDKLTLGNQVCSGDGVAQGNALSNLFSTLGGAAAYGQGMGKTTGSSYGGGKNAFAWNENMGA